VGIHLAAEHALELEPAHAVFQTERILLDVARGGFVVLAFGQLEQLGGVGDGFGGAVDGVELGRQPRAFAAELLGLVGRGPDGGVFELAVDLFEAFLLAVVFKETPGGWRFGRSGL